MDDLHVFARGECVDVRADRHGKFLIGFERQDVSTSVDVFMAFEHYAPAVRASSWILQEDSLVCNARVRLMIGSIPARRFMS